MIRTPSTPLLAALVAFAAMIAPTTLTSGPTAAAEPDGTTWALQPASPDGPDGRVSLRHSVTGGEQIDELIAVTNFSTTSARFAVYASDGAIGAGGNFDLVPSDRAPSDGGAWIAIDPIEGSAPRAGGGIIVDVPANSAVLVPVRIDVPANATPGDHPAGIVAELVRDEGEAVQLSTRVGVRVHLRVTGDLVAALAPESVIASYTPSWNPFAPGTATVRYTVVNSGNVRLGATTTITAAGVFGLGGGAASTEQREMLPGDLSEATVELPMWPVFFGWGEVQAVPGVIGEDAGDVALRPTAAGFTVVAIPWSQLALAVLLVGGILLARMLRARSQRRMQARIDAAVAAATGAPAAIEPTPAPLPLEPATRNES